MNYKYNESKYAEIIYNKGFQSKRFLTELKLLVLYYRHTLNLKAKEREDKIIDFCKEYIQNFKKENFYNIINKALREGLNKKRQFVDIDSIEVYKGEIDYINSLDVKYEYKKVLFTLMIQMRLNKINYKLRTNKEYDSIYFTGGIKTYNNIKKISNINPKISINDEVINTLCELSIIRILHKGTIILDYLNNCEQTGEVVIYVKDYNNVGLYFDYYNGVKGVLMCEVDVCGSLFKSKANYHKFCKQCAREINKIKTKERMKKNRLFEDEKII